MAERSDLRLRSFCLPSRLDGEHPCAVPHQERRVPKGSMDCGRSALLHPSPRVRESLSCCTPVRQKGLDTVLWFSVVELYVRDDGDFGVVVESIPLWERVSSFFEYPLYAHLLDFCTMPTCISGKYYFRRALPRFSGTVRNRRT